MEGGGDDDDENCGGGWLLMSLHDLHVHCLLSEVLRCSGAEVTS